VRGWALRTAAHLEIALPAAKIHSAMEDVIAQVVTGLVVHAGVYRTYMNPAVPWADTKGLARRQIETAFQTAFAQVEAGLSAPQADPYPHAKRACLTALREIILPGKRPSKRWRRRLPLSAHAWISWKSCND